MSEMVKRKKELKKEKEISARRQKKEPIEGVSTYTGWSNNLVLSKGRYPNELLFPKQDYRTQELGIKVETKKITEIG